MIVKAYRKWIDRECSALDVGCGSGLVVMQIAKKFKLDVVGCDLKNYLLVELPFVWVEKEDRLPFDSLSFDIVMFNDTLHHISKVNQMRLLKEAFRVGRKVLIFEVEPTISAYIFDWLVNRLHRYPIKMPFTFRTSGQWLNLFKRLKVRAESAEVATPFYYPFKHQAFCLFK